MTPTADLILKGSTFLDVAGVLGLALLALAAIRLARREHSWGGNTMAFGAISLLVARIFLLSSPYFMTRDMMIALGPLGLSATIALPAILLSFGLGGVVWGLWGHSRWLHEER